jgi:hypothetical protein
MVIMTSKPVLRTAKKIITNLRGAIATIGKDILGFEAHEIVIHPLGHHFLIPWSPSAWLAK